MCTINVGLSRPPKDIKALYTLVPHSVHPGLSGIGFDHNKAPGRVPEGKGHGDTGTGHSMVRAINPV